MLKVGELGQHAASRGEVQASRQVHHTLLPLGREGVIAGWALHADGGYADAGEVQLERHDLSEFC